MPDLYPMNPYVVGPSLKEDYGFYGRQSLIASIVDYLTRVVHQNAIVLHGQRRIGKTSLLHHLGRNKTLHQSHVPIFFDLQQRKGFPLARILAELTETIIATLKLDIRLPQEARLANDYGQFKREILPEIYQHLPDKRLLILLDEFDVAVPVDIADRFPADTVLGYLQTLIEEDQRRLAFVFVVGQRLDLLAEGYRRLFRGARTEPVGRLDQGDTIKLLTELGQQGYIGYSSEALQTIWDLTNGHPYLTQLIGFEIFERLQGQQLQEATPDDVEACLDKAMKHGLGALDWFWTGFNHDEQLVLAAVAELTGRQPNISEADIDKLLRQHALFLSERDRHSACTQLLEGDFLTDIGGQHYKFAVEFIRRWIVKTHSVTEVKRQTYIGNPEAQTYYQKGLQLFERGNLAEAEWNLHQAVKLDPHFPDARRGLARVLRALGDIEGALKEYEEAYKLDPSNTREELIGFRLDCVAQLEAGVDDEEILTHSRRILQIDTQNAQAHQWMARICLSQASAHLDAFKPKEALAILRNLIDPLPIIQDNDVGQQVRDLWLNYSQKLTQRKPPLWDEAQQALDDLVSIELLDEKTRVEYNRVVLEKARVSLEKDMLAESLEILLTDLKPPLPIKAIIDLFVGYKDRQIEHQRWQQAASTLEGLCELINHKQTQVILLDFYHQWGDMLLKAEKFNESIAVYQKGKANKGVVEDFKQKIGDVYLRQAAWHVDRDEFSKARVSYQQASANLGTKIVKESALSKLSGCFNSRRREQEWEKAGQVLQLLRDLALSDEDVYTWQTDLYLDQAKTALNQKDPETAFNYLANLGDQEISKIKGLMKNYLQQEARNGEWQAGADALQHLERFLPNDATATTIRANWLFSWAKTIAAKDGREENLIEAKRLCLEVLSLAPKNTPVIDFLPTAKSLVTQESENLHREVAGWSANISLELGQKYLNRANLNEALTFFDEALNLLPHSSDTLAAAIQEKLEAFSQAQIRNKDWNKARQALQSILDLGIGGHETNQKLTRLAITQAELLFKTDQPELAFSILSHLDPEVKDKQRPEVEALAYKFSRLYAGRTRWAEAKLTLCGLNDWLPPADSEAIIYALDILNRERLYLTRARRLATTNKTEAPPEIINYLREEVSIIEDGYNDAKAMGALQPETVEAWIQQFIQVNLELGRALLCSHDLTATIQLYQKILDWKGLPIQDHDKQVNDLIEVNLALGDAYLSSHDLPNVIKIYQEILALDDQSAGVPKPIHRQISQRIYDYSDQLLAEADEVSQWDRAQEALEQLKSLDLQTPYGSIPPPDPRIDGAIQRVILQKTQTLLKEDKIEAAFDQLERLPMPWPEGVIKEIIWDYNQQQRTQENGGNAIIALRCLELFLANDQDQARDQDTLARLINSLVQWGQRLENKTKLAEAADVYYEAAVRARDAAPPKSLELAPHFVRVTMHLAQNLLECDPLHSEEPPVIDQAIQQYLKIVNLLEHQQEHEQQLNEKLLEHAHKLVRAGQWDRAYRILEKLDYLYQSDLNENRRALFADWRKELVLDEMEHRLRQEQLNTAFTRLAWFNEWLVEKEAPETIWLDSIAEIKSRIDHFVIDIWHRNGAYELAVQTLDYLIKLLPNDAKIVGWQVETLCLWGQSLHKQNHLSEALMRYKQAHSLVRAQDIVPIADIDTLMVETLLVQAEQYLAIKRPDLESAVEIYEEVLKRQGDNLDHSDHIRRTLKKYSDAWTQQHPPNWKAAHQALDQLVKLNLHNKQVSAWKRALTLQEIRANLQQDKSEEAFASLEQLERPWPITEIQEIVHQYWHNRMKLDWHLAIEALRNLGKFLREDALARQWIVQELMELGEKLDEQGHANGAGEAFKAAVDLA